MKPGKALSGGKWDGISSNQQRETRRSFYIRSSTARSSSECFLGKEGWDGVSHKSISLLLENPPWKGQEPFIHLRDSRIVVTLGKMDGLLGKAAQKILPGAGRDNSQLCPSPTMGSFSGSEMGQDAAETSAIDPCCDRAGE